jgi:hypothetical protein
MLNNFWRTALAVAACLTFAAAASAQDAKPAAPAAPAAKTTTAKKPPSECAGLDNAACTAKPQCSWYKEVTTKDGKKRKAHCQKKPTHAAKKPATTAPATTAPAPAPKT